MVEIDNMYRIMILYMLNKVEYPLTNTQITNFILEKDYTNYFTVQQTLSDLQSSELISAQSTHNNTRYHITETGRETLKFFEDKISPAIKKDIADYFREHHYDLVQETSVYADYYKSAAGTGYEVHCRANHRETPILDIGIHVSGKEQAVAICENWKKQHVDVYTLLMDALLK